MSRHSGRCFDAGFPNLFIQSQTPSKNHSDRQLCQLFEFSSVSSRLSTRKPTLNGFKSKYTIVKEGMLRHCGAQEPLLSSVFPSTCMPDKIIFLLELFHVSHIGTCYRIGGTEYNLMFSFHRVYP